MWCMGGGYVFTSALLLAALELEELAAVACGSWHQFDTGMPHRPMDGVLMAVLLTLLQMADDHHEHDVHFESADAGASKTYPQQAGAWTRMQPWAPLGLHSEAT